MNLICRLYDVNDGSVCVGGIDVRNYDTEVLRNQVSVVLQKNTLFSGSILDNLRWEILMLQMRNVWRHVKLPVPMNY